MQHDPQTLTAGRLVVVAAALIAPDGRVCMHRRPADKEHGDLWEFPGGKVEAGEDLRSALARELAEELGIAVDPAHFIPAGFADSRPAHGRALVILLYAARAWEGEAQCLEGGGIGWFVPDSLSQLAMPPLDYPLAQALVELLAKGAI